VFLFTNVGKSDIIQYDYNPKNAKIVGIEYSISDEKIAKINGNTITAEAGGSATISVKEIGSGKIGTCTITVEKPPSPPDKIDGGGTGSSNPSGYYKVVDAGGNITYHASLEEAEEAARNATTGEGFAEIFYKSSSTNDKEIKYSETEIVEDYGNGEGEYEIKIYNGSSTPVGESKVTINDNGTFIYVWDLDGNLISKEIIENPNKNTSNNNSGSSNKKPTSTLEDVKDKPTGSVTTVITDSGKPVGVTTCLEAGTKVLTKKGYKNIEEIVEGDIVLSYNEKKDKNEYKKVTQVYKHTDSIDVLYSIYLNSQLVEATEFHKFYVKVNNGYRYVSVKNLKVGDKLIDLNGNEHIIRKINSKIKKSNYYDIEIEDNHNYYISEKNILVHNVAVKQPEPPTTTTTKKATTKTTTKKTTTKTTTKKTTTKTTTKKTGGGTCLVKGTKIKLANGREKNIEDITYNDLLLVWNFETGSYTYEYPIWIEKEGKASSYINILFDDNTELNIVDDHGVFDIKKNMFVNIDDLKVGSKVAKIVDNNVKSATIVSINEIVENVSYYHIFSTRYYNVIANSILTSDYNVFFSNFRGFNDDFTWKVKEYDSNQLYTYDELSYWPYYLYIGFRVEEAKVFENVLSKDEFKAIMNSDILNENKHLSPKVNILGNRMWMVTTSDDNINLVNEFKYLKEEGSKYLIPKPNIEENFIGWYNSADGNYYNPGDIINIYTGVHLIAMYK